MCIYIYMRPLCGQMYELPWAIGGLVMTERAHSLSF